MKFSMFGSWQNICKVLLCLIQFLGITICFQTNYYNTPLLPFCKQVFPSFLQNVQTIYPQTEQTESIDRILLQTEHMDRRQELLSGVVVAHPCTQMHFCFRQQLKRLHLLPKNNNKTSITGNPYTSHLSMNPTIQAYLC